MLYSQQMRRFGSFCIFWLLQSTVSNSLSISEEVRRIENDERSPFLLYGNPDLFRSRGHSHHRHEGEHRAREYPAEFAAANGQAMLDQYDRLSRQNLMNTQNPFMPSHHHRRSGNHETNTHEKDILRMKYFEDLAKHHRHRHGEGHGFREYPSEYAAMLDQFDEMNDQYPLSPFNQHRRSEDRELNDFPHHSSSHRKRHRKHLPNPFYEQSEMYANNDREDIIRYREEMYCQQHPAKCSRAHGRRDQSYPGELDGRYPMYKSPEEPIDPIQMQQFTAALASLSFIDRPKNPQPKLPAKLNEPTQSVDDRGQDTSQTSPTSLSENSKDEISPFPDRISERNKESNPPVTPAPSKDMKKTGTIGQSKSDGLPTITDDKSKLKKQSDSLTSNDLNHSVESKDQSQVTVPSDSSKLNEFSKSSDHDKRLENEPESSAVSGDKIESTKVDNHSKSDKTETDEHLVDAKSADSHTQDEKPDDESKSAPASGSSDDQPKDIKSEA